MKSKLFEEVTINGLTIKNRFVLSAAFKAETPAEKFAAFAQADVGLIISGGSHVHEIRKFEKAIKAVHENQGKMAVQIVSHIGGRFGFQETPDVIAVSHLTEESSFFSPLVKYCDNHAATEEEIKKIIDSYVEAAVLAQSVRADALQIHSAHQSFLSQFLSPITNKRTDRWGGSVENRTRIHKAIIDSIRARVGKNFPILIKLGVEDAIAGGLPFSEGKEIAQMIASYGYDAIEVSQGLQDFRMMGNSHAVDWEKTPIRSHVHRIENEAYFRKWAHEIKNLVSVPIIVTGGIRSYELCEELIEKGEADLIGLCRPLVREADLIQRWKRNDHRKAKCISCNKCLTELLMKGLPFECYLDKRK